MKFNLKSLLIICCGVFVTLTVATDANASTSKVRLGAKIDTKQLYKYLKPVGWTSLNL